MYSEEDIRCDSVILLLVSFRTAQGASDFLQIGLQDSKQFVVILVKIGLQACEVPFIGSDNRWTCQGDSSRQDFNKHLRLDINLGENFTLLVILGM